MSKFLVFTIVVIFVGAGIIPSTVGIKKEKTTITTTDSPGYIQDLIDNASNGDTIYIPSGIYYENIVIDKSISLIGEDKYTTIIDGSNIGDVIYVSADWVNISGFTIQNSQIYYDHAGIHLDSNYNKIEGNILTSNRGSGIFLDSNNNIITENEILNNEEFGISLYGDNNLITRNIIFYNNYAGISLTSYNSTITKNIIYFNNIYVDYYRAGIYLVWCGYCKIIDNILNENGITLYESSTNIVDNNTISNCDCGLGLDVCWGPFCNNIFSNNSFFNSGVKIGLGEGLYENNTFSDNTVNEKPFVYLENESDKVIDVDAGQICLINCDNITVQNQDLSNTIIGIFLGGTDNSSILNNTISSNMEAGIFFWDSSNNNIFGNNISSNNLGIYICYSNGNTIYHNNLLFNTKNADDDGENTWDDGKYGNYWSDYEEKYPDAKPKLFKPWMWNTPYEISGGDNKDNCPLLKQWPSLKFRDLPRNRSTFQSLIFRFLEQFPRLEIFLNYMREVMK